MTNIVFMALSGPKSIQTKDLQHVTARANTASAPRAVGLQQNVSRISERNNWVFCVLRPTKSIIVSADSPRTVLKDRHHRHRTSVVVGEHCSEGILRQDFSRRTKERGAGKPSAHEPTVISECSAISGMPPRWLRHTQNCQLSDVS